MSDDRHGVVQGRYDLQLRPEDMPGHTTGPSLLEQRMAWEEAHPRPENIRRAERMIVRALVAEGFGRQHQVTHQESFEIAVDNLLISVRINPDA